MLDFVISGWFLRAWIRIQRPDLTKSCQISPGQGAVRFFVAVSVAQGNFSSEGMPDHHFGVAAQMRRKIEQVVDAGFEPMGRGRTDGFSMIAQIDEREAKLGARPYEAFGKAP